MSHSYKKEPIVGTTTARSDKPAKKQAHKAVRSDFKDALRNCNDLEEFVFEEKNVAHSDIHTTPKGEKRYVHDLPVDVAHHSREGEVVQVKEITDKSKDIRQVHKLVGK